MIELNASKGGQVLRTSLSLSCILNKPVKLVNIRQDRPKPGLQAQHLTCVNALKEICNAEVKGNELNSTTLEFTPKKIKSGKYVFDIKTAGSITLLAQCLLPVLLYGEGQSEIQFIGGTHVPFSPPADYFTDVFLASIAKMGVKAYFEVENFGFYPTGGGKAVLKVEPSKLKPFKLTKREKQALIQIRSFYSRLPHGIGQRQADTAVQILSSNVDTVVKEKQATCPGSFVFVHASYGNCTAGFSSLGKKGKSAEAVASEAVKEFKRFEKTGACVDEHLADQLLIYCALTEKSEFTTSTVSEHFKTNVNTIKHFLKREVSVDNGLVVVK